MTPHRTTLALLLLAAALVLAAGCADHQSNSIQVITSPPASPGLLVPLIPTPEIAAVQNVYVVREGEPFVYRAIVNDTGVHSVNVTVLSQPDMIFPFTLQVDENRTITLFLGGNITGEFRDLYSYTFPFPPYNQGISPYLHIILTYPVKQERIDVLVTGNDTNRTAPEDTSWIQVDPVRDIVVSPDDRMNFTGPFFINGTTNLPPGTNLSLEISSLCFWPCPKYDPDQEGATLGCCGTREKYTAATRVVEHSPTPNIWSFPVNTSPVRIVIGTENARIGDTNRFRAIVKDVNRTIDDDRWDLADFVVRVRGVP